MEVSMTKPIIPDVVYCERDIPLTNERYYIIDLVTLNLLKEFIALCDMTPEKEWRAWTEEEKIQYSSAANIAYEIVRNSVVKQ